MALSFSVPDTELSLILHNRRTEVVDNIMKGTPFLNAMRSHGGVETVNGGLQLVQPIMYSKNATAQSFTGFDLLDTTPQENETSAIYDWCDLGATVAIAWDTQMKNQGRGMLINVLNQKIKDAEMSMRDLLNTQALATQPAAGSKNLNSITEIVDEAPTADCNRTTAQGGIGNANTWWRNQYTTGGAFTIADMNTMWNTVSDGSDIPSFLLTGQTPFEYYENALVGQIRYADTRSADAGFESLLFKSKPIYWDPGIGNTDEIYFLNTKYFKLSIMSGADFVTTDFVEPDNQAAKVAKILWMGQLNASNRRRLGTLHGITAPA